MDGAFAGKEQKAESVYAETSLQPISQMAGSSHPLL